MPLRKPRDRDPWVVLRFKETQGLLSLGLFFLFTGRSLFARWPGKLSPPVFPRRFPLQARTLSSRVRSLGVV